MYTHVSAKLIWWSIVRVHRDVFTNLILYNCIQSDLISQGFYGLDQLLNFK